jgi:hypothetical protein
MWRGCQIVRITSNGNFCSHGWNSQSKQIYSFLYLVLVETITVAVRCKAWISFGLLESWNRGFESHWRHGCLEYVPPVFVLFCVQISALRRADPPVQGILPTVYKLKKFKSGQGPTKGLWRHREIDKQYWWVSILSASCEGYCTMTSVSEQHCVKRWIRMDLEKSGSVLYVSFRFHLDIFIQLVSNYINNWNQ